MKNVVDAEEERVGTTVDFDPFRAGEVTRTAPSTEPQREIITSACISDEANIAFNEAVSLRVAGAVDPATIESALRTIVDRHDALRSTFTRSGDQLCVTDENPFALELLDYRSMDDEEREAAIHSLWRELAQAPLDLFEGPLFRALWVQLADDLGELVLLAHHVVCDGWSFHVVLEELSHLCSGRPAGELAPAPSFAEFAERQNAEAAANADADYWAERFATTPPVLELPTDRVRPLFRTFAAQRIDHTFDPEIVKTIGAAAGKMKASVVNVTLAATAALLHRLSGVTDLAIGLPVARQGMQALDNLVGHGVQLLPIRVQLDEHDTFGEVVARAKGEVLETRDHYDFTFGSLVRDLGLSGDPSRVPLCPVIFNIDQAFGELSLGTARATLRTVPRVAENFEIFLNILPSREGLVVEATFNTDLFSADTIRHWLSALESLLVDGVRDPDKSIGALRLTDGDPEIYETLNDTRRDHAPGVWFDRLATAANEAPDDAAVVDAGGTLTYDALETRSSALARALAAHGVGPGTIVGLFLQRNRDLVVALAAVHKAGAAYLPLDPSLPEKRLALMLEDSGARLVLADRDLPTAMELPSLRTLALEELAAAGEAEAELPRVEGADLAYLMYTSGSTGTPKGVEVMHRNVANFLDSMAVVPGISADDTLLAVTTLSFDISVLELLLPLTRGATVVVAASEETSDARRLAELLSRHEITMMQATPSTWRLLLGDGWAGMPELTALCGGEPLPADLAAPLARKVKALWNMYGPTETTVWSTCTRVEPGGEISIGRPIDNTTVHVMDALGQPLPATVPGEIWIGGSGVARGYHGREELTAEKFVEHPELGRLYRTGDLGRILHGGGLSHLGRLDDQVKVRGFRIELPEIEVSLAEHPDVAQAAVHLWNAKPGDVRIVACCVPQRAGSLSPIKLRKHLRARLPEYMIPQHFLPVDEIPLTPNGKVDRRGLPTPVVTESRIGRHEAPSDPIEATIAGIWTKLLHPDRPVGRDDKFFEIGGHSLLGLEALRQIEAETGNRLDPRLLYRDTLAELAARCRAESTADGSARSTRPTPVAEGDELLASRTQERIYRRWRNDPETLRFHVPFSFKLHGALDAERLTDALRAVYERHAALRTIFRDSVDGRVAHRQLSPAAAFHLEQCDLSDRTDPEAEAMRLMIAETKKPFDLLEGPLVRQRLIRLAPDLHILFFMPHQVVFDGWSFDLVLQELNRNYARLEKGETLDVEIPALQYGDVTTWQRGIAADAETTTYWRSALRDLPSRIEWPGAGNGTVDGVERVKFVIGRDKMERYETVCHERGIKLQTFILAAFARVLGAATGVRDLSIGLASSGRFVPELAPLVGLFYRNLPLQMRLPEATDGSALLEYVHETLSSLNGRQDITLDELTELAAAGGSGDPEPQVSFSFQDARNRLPSIGSLRLEQVSVSRPDLERDLDFWVRNTPTGLIASLDYRAGVAGAEFFEGLRDDLINVFEALPAGHPVDVDGLVATRLPLEKVAEGSQ